MASVVKVAFGWLILCRPYATDRPGQLRVWQLFRARGQTASQADPGPTTDAIRGNRRWKSQRN